MKFLIALLLCAYFVFNVAGYRAGSSGCTSSDYPNLGEISRGNTKRVQGVCAEVYCDNGGNAVVHNCGPIAVEPPCRADKGDVSKSYPDCCYEIVCSPPTSGYY